MHCGPAGKSDQSLQQKQDSLECPTSLRRSNFCDEFTQLSGNLQADKCTKSYKHEACSCECKDVCDTLGGGEWTRIEWRRVNEEEWRRVNGRPWVGAKTPSLLHMWTPLLCEPLSNVNLCLMWPANLWNYTRTPVHVLVLATPVIFFWTALLPFLKQQHLNRCSNPWEGSYKEVVVGQWAICQHFQAQEEFAYSPEQTMQHV